MITPAEIAALKRKCERPNYGSRYVSLAECLEVIKAYEAAVAERDALLEAAKVKQIEMFEERQGER